MARPAVPILRSAPTDPILDHGRAVAETAVTALETDPHLHDTASALDDADSQQAVVIVGHELIWDLADALSVAPGID